ncbi:hypothetical protein COCSADRAFT_201340 [Bipolaris sorokiniana ND90Pr]|uniref:BZIP domain-containing protein n=1 Tax=Cochliobolus sativus (strain ND90Pr / ATCC 201652) TaxID=665912 RepID=M2R3K0_COCSN|nr:uncharacterized protein COCSADRAFT_201340 [Bipolaris sorokiniana ND90Pr]EMD61784.1 hypothetical protein COCSADRAFT_201340 [Bipolaris sorokiniana ND90Pr]
MASGQQRTRRAAANLQPDNSLPDTEDSKRVANRLAQRKFRRQRKDYIAHLENELALCRAGASEEIDHRRLEVARLREEKAALRELLEHVICNLSQICGTDISIAGISTQRQHNALVCPTTPTEKESQCDYNPSGSCHSAQGERLSERGQEPFTDDTNREDLERAIDQEGASAAQFDTSMPNAVLNADTSLQFMTDDAPIQPSQLCSHASGPAQPSTNIIARAPIQDELSINLALIWNGVSDESQPPDSVGADHHGQRRFGGGSFHQPSADHTNKDAQRLLTGRKSPMSDFDSFLFRTPGNLRNICRSSGCLGRHDKSEKTQLMSIMLRRRTDEVIDSCTRSGDLVSLQSIQAMEQILVNGLVNTILSMQAMCMQLLGIESMSLSGGCAWVVWQIVKTFWVLPRLADCGVLATATELGFYSDVFHDTMPAWLRPTDIQKTFEHSIAIDFIPWAHLRESLIMHEDEIVVDDVFVSLLKRQIPTGAESDRLVNIKDDAPWDSIRRQFQTSHDRFLRDSFYGSVSMFKLGEVCELDSAIPICTNLLVDSLMAHHDELSSIAT